MRIVIDLQACQSSGSRNRGIGRYSMSLAQEMVRLGQEKHEFWLALNGGFAETVPLLRKAFAETIPQERMLSWQAPKPLAESMLPIIQQSLGWVYGSMTCTEFLASWQKSTPDEPSTGKASSIIA